MHNLIKSWPSYKLRDSNLQFLGYMFQLHSLPYDIHCMNCYLRSAWVWRGYKLAKGNKAVTTITSLSCYSGEVVEIEKVVPSLKPDLGIFQVSFKIEDIFFRCFQSKSMLYPKGKP